MKTELHTTSLEAGRKIKEYLGEETPGSYFVFRHWRGTGEIFVDKKKEKYYDYPKSRRMPHTTDSICPAFLFSELILDVLPKIAGKEKVDDTYFIKQDLFDLLILGGMEAVSERIIKVINEK